MSLISRFIKTLNILTSNENATPKYTSISQVYIENTFTEGFLVISWIQETDTILTLLVLT